jgi:hypothetical protein
MIRDIHSWKECKMAVSQRNGLEWRAFGKKLFRTEMLHYPFTALSGLSIRDGTLIKNSSAIEEMAEV